MSLAQNEAPRRVVEETKRLYSSLLSHQLSDKQLARPTFKFIQDVVRRLITETKILRNIFNANDFNDEKRFADRRGKSEFIQKLVDFVANHKQPVVGCVAAKIVAGLEPTKANELLQALARIAQSRLSGQDGTSTRPRTFTKPLQQQLTPKPTATINPRRGSSTSGSASSQRTRSGGSSRKTSVQIPPGNSSPKTREPMTSSQQQVVPSTTNTNRIAIEVGKSNAGTNYSVETPANTNQSADSRFSSQQARDQKRQAPPPTLSSESDIGGKNLQQLRSHLKGLRGTLKEIAQMEDSLRSRLTSVLDNSVG